MKTKSKLPETRGRKPKWNLMVDMGKGDLKIFKGTMNHVIMINAYARTHGYKVKCTYDKATGTINLERLK